MHITRTRKKSTANLKLIDNLIVSTDTSTPSMARSADLTWLQNPEASGLKQRMIVCVLSVTEWLVSNVAKRILIRTYKFSTANKILPPLRTFFCRKPSLRTNAHNHILELLQPTVSSSLKAWVETAQPVKLKYY